MTSNESKASTGRGMALIMTATLQLAAIAQTGASSARFEAAAVRPSSGTVFRKGPLTVADPLIRLEGYTVFGLILDAYNVKDFQVKLSPAIPKDDAAERQYDIVARAPGPGTPKLEDVRVMLQNLLADRFQLKVHHETTETQVYALTVGRGGARLKASAAGGECSVHTALARDGRNNEEVFSSCPVERLADRLANMVGDRPVLDRTGLRGVYDFRLIAIPEYRSRERSEAADIDPVTAVGELGLRMISQKGAVDVIAVDRLERPTEN